MLFMRAIQKDDLFNATRIQERIDKLVGNEAPKRHQLIPPEELSKEQLIAEFTEIVGGTDLKVIAGPTGTSRTLSEGVPSQTADGIPEQESGRVGQEIS